MKKNLFLFGILLFILSPLASFGKGPKMIFEQNKNQWPSNVLFKTDIPGGNLFLEKDMLTYNYIETINWHKDHRNESGGPVKVKYHTIKVGFQNSNPNVEVFGNNLMEGCRNYYLGNDPKKWASNVPIFEAAYYKNLYENIDMHLYNVDNNFKYDFIVQTGGDPKNIQLNYNGPDAMRIENGHLFIKTSLYDLIEQKPYAYQEINGVKTEVPCEYVLNNNKITFAFSGTYDKTLPLIIDPTLIAATYSGSYGDNWGYTATYDNASNIYMAGIVAMTGYPATVGSWDQTFNGGLPISSTQWPMDIAIAKFNPTGTTLMYATYYGGSNNDQPHSMIVNSNNELYVVGRTNSSNFPKTAGAYGVYSAGYDIIVGKFNTSGNLLASSIIGGTGDDCVNYNITWDAAGAYGATKFNYADDGRSEIILDNNSNVYVAACSRSTNFPVTAGCYQSAFGGTQDAVVFKMTSTLAALTFSTYLGGTGTDAGYGLKLDNSNNIYVTGGTTGSFPTTAGVLHTTYQGGIADAFIAVLASGGNTLLRSTYLGTTAYDQAYLIEIDASGDIYVYGQTQGAYPVTAGVYSNAGGGMFVHKVSGLLNSTVFSTRIGTGANAVNISPTAFLVDSCQTIYISGWARTSALSSTMPSPSTSTGLYVTPNAHQPTTDGRDFYFMVLKPNAIGVYYATFYGENQLIDGDHVDGGTSRFDKRGVIYHACCASCGGTQNFPTTPGCYSAVNNGGVPPPYSGINCNEAVVKMDVSVKPLAIANLIGSPNGCVPHTVTFSNTGSQAAYFIWDFGDGSPIDTLINPSHTYSFVGTYTLTLYAIDSIGICGYIDTASLVINVGQPPTLASSVSNILCNGGVGSATVTPTGGMPPLTYAWNTSPQQTSATASGLSPGTYVVTVTDAIGCSATSSVSITDPPPIVSTAQTVGATCGIPNGSITASVSGGTPAYTYYWSPGGYTTSSVTGLLSGAYSYTVTDMNGCTNTGSGNISVANGPTVTTTGTNALCNGGTTGSATAAQIGGTGPYTYVWGTTPVQTAATATGLAAGTYTVSVTDANGCSGISSVTISQPPSLAASITSTNALCFNSNTGSATVTPSGGTPGYNYSWAPSGGNGPTASNLGANTYTVTITDSHGCTTTQSATISQPLALNASTTSSGSSCGTSANGVASASATGGTAPYTYSWNTTPVQTTQSVSNLPGGSYVVTVTDSKGCTTTSTTTIPVSTQPMAAFLVDSAISCEGIAFMFMDQSLLGLSWSWDFGDGTTSTQQNPVHVFPYSNSYVVSLIVSNPPCKDTATITLNVGDITTYATIGAANVFTPNGDGDNDCFRPALIGPGADTLAACIELEVYDRWGVKVFKSDNVTMCWDGNIQKNKKPASDGTYYYIAKLKGTTIKNYVTLVRK